MKLLLNLVGVMLIGWVFVLVGPEVESAYFPVLKNFRVIEQKQDGNDVVITASVNKVRGCTYIAPWRARSQTGRMLQVIHDQTDAPNWPAERGIVTTFTVLATGGESFTLTAEHSCHEIGWHVFSELGVIK